MLTASEAYIKCMNEVMALGWPAGDTLEIVNHTMVYSLRHPAVLSRTRNLSYKYMASEALWTIQGSNKLNFNDSIYKTLGKYSIDGLYLNSGYGPAFISQMPYIIETLGKDMDSRRAIIEIWERKPFNKSDIPCTISLQILIRKHQLHCIVNMRSSDVWLGLPNDMFVFAMMAAMVRAELQHLFKYPLELGTCYLNAASRHIYSDDMADAKRVLKEPDIATNEKEFDSPRMSTLIWWLSKWSQESKHMRDADLMKEYIDV